MRREYSELLASLLKPIITGLKFEKIKEIRQPELPLVKEPKKPTLVSVRPVSDNPDNKTYLGFYLGDFATGTGLMIREDHIQVENSGHNPAMYVPDLGKIVYGYESWWGPIKSEDELHQITDDEIQNLWYVQAMKAFAKADEVTE